MILETSLLDDEQKMISQHSLQVAGAEFVKTSTGFSTGGATVHDVALMRQAVGEEMGVKASGGIRTVDDLKNMAAAGATRIGASAGVKIIESSSALVSDAEGRYNRRYALAAKPRVRFRERVELLDFLLEVSRVTSETLDLDKLLANVGVHRQGRALLRSVRDSLVQRTREGT